jgi:glycosyltransferase involved in cell wall biosynthesis
MKVALVHDWLTGMRGGEKVLEVLCELFPDADLFTLYHVPGAVSPLIERRRIFTSFVQSLPMAKRFYRRYLPLFPLAIERFRFDSYDLVVSSSHCVAKSARVPPHVPHICYCHSPMRYAWDQFDAYFGPERVGAVASRLVYRPILSRLARWDARTSTRVRRFVANSGYVAGRIRRYYNRDAAVVYPPVDTDFFHPGPSQRAEPHFLVVSALVPYKRIDLAIDAAMQAGYPLRIVGDGPELARLQARAGPGVRFLGPMSGATLRDEYRKATAVLLPGEEDFGIVPVEAQACGTPVVALGRGGALETVRPGVTGLLFEEPSPSSLAAALTRAAAMRPDPGLLQAHAEQFSRSRHVAALRAVVDETLAAPPGTTW